ncbi:hypothetical protein STSP2_01008 [Anaerohalosphaera lusitana]|uniref:Uncharacterized protein n=1 Tax=Anaerohalosphaera lusitana TaxID=1936003 RepID=A0A1U9NK18_9BACT|nr:hypothetical protein STSP2_01008 [Anaerohalosphaera lusitana]
MSSFCENRLQKLYSGIFCGKDSKFNIVCFDVIEYLAYKECQLGCFGYYLRLATSFDDFFGFILEIRVDGL